MLIQLGCTSSRNAIFGIFFRGMVYTLDTAQVLTFYLCHGFTRCNRTIGEVIPLRYAALAAERGRIWITKSLYDSDFSSDT